MKGVALLAETDGVGGLSVSPVRVTGVAVTVISVDEPFMVPLRVAFTKMPTVPAVVPALNVAVVVEGVREPSAVLERIHAYVMVPGHVALQVGVAVNC